eukprot:Gb_11340 [translate_table: standard]
MPLPIFRSPATTDLSHSGAGFLLYRIPEALSLPFTNFTKGPPHPLLQRVRAQPELRFCPPLAATLTVYNKISSLFQYTVQASDSKTKQKHTIAEYLVIWVNLRSTQCTQSLKCDLQSPSLLWAEVDFWTQGADQQHASNNSGYKIWSLEDNTLMTALSLFFYFYSPRLSNHIIKPINKVKLNSVDEVLLPKKDVKTYEKGANTPMLNYIGSLLGHACSLQLMEDCSGIIYSEQSSVDKNSNASLKLCQFLLYLGNTHAWWTWAKHEIGIDKEHHKLVRDSCEFFSGYQWAGTSALSMTAPMANIWSGFSLPRLDVAGNFCIQGGERSSILQRIKWYPKLCSNLFANPMNFWLKIYMLRIHDQPCLVLAG